MFYTARASARWRRQFSSSRRYTLVGNPILVRVKEGMITLVTIGLARVSEDVTEVMSQGLRISHVFVSP